MIPDYTKLLNLNIDNIQIQTSKDYNINDNNFIYNISAMEQVVYKILNTKRYTYPIYSWNYGVEFDDLFGKPVIYVCAEIENRISDALIYDERINKVYNFIFDTSKKRIVSVSFIVETIFGDLNVDKEVNY